MNNIETLETLSTETVAVDRETETTETETVTTETETEKETVIPEIVIDTIDYTDLMLEMNYKLENIQAYQQANNVMLNNITTEGIPLLAGLLLVVVLFKLLQYIYKFFNMFF